MLKNRICVATALFVFAANAVSAADLDTGLAAYGQGDHETAMAELRPLAEEGIAEAQHFLGLMYLLGQGVAEDGYQASTWFLKAAEQGHGYAQLRLARIYDNGLGVPPHDADAVAWYRRAAEQGLPEAQLRMGQLYGGYGGSSKGDSRDDAESLTWFHRAAQQGNADAQWYLGNAYKWGSGVEEDVLQSFAWFNLAIAFGNENAREQTADLRRDMIDQQVAEAQELSRRLFAEIRERLNR